jgi:hypothetical protein
VTLGATHIKRIDHQQDPQRVAKQHPDRPRRVVGFHNGLSASVMESRWRAIPPAQAVGLRSQWSLLAAFELGSRARAARIAPHNLRAMKTPVKRRPRMLVRDVNDSRPLTLAAGCGALSAWDSNESGHHVLDEAFHPRCAGVVHEADLKMLDTSPDELAQLSRHLIGISGDDVELVPAG